jgi:hypothetical protein
MLFFQAVTYNIAEVDDGSCEDCSDKTACLSEPSALSRGANKCYWDNDANTCHYIEPVNDLLRVVYVAIISAMWSAPIALGVNWLVMNVLSAQTALSSTQVESAADFSTHSIVVDGSPVNNSSSTVCHKQIFAQSIAEEVHDLNEAVVQYKQTLHDTEKREYAAVWGIDMNTGRFISNTNLSSNVIVRYFSQLWQRHISKRNIDFQKNL